MLDKGQQSEEMHKATFAVKHCERMPAASGVVCLPLSLPSVVQIIICESTCRCMVLEGVDSPCLLCDLHGMQSCQMSTSAGIYLDIAFAAARCTGIRVAASSTTFSGV